MPIRSLLLPIVFVCGSSLAAAQSPTPTPCGFAYGNVCGGFSARVNPVVTAPRYVGLMASNSNPSAPAAQPNMSALLQSQPAVVKLGTPSRKATCYAIRSYAFKPSSDTIGVTHLTGSSTCEAADNTHLKRADQP